MTYGREASYDQQWLAAKPKGWGNKAHGFDRQERADRAMHSGERKMLYDIMGNDENIKALVGGTYRAQGSTGASRGVAVATNTRIIFLDKGVLGSTEISEVSYRRIEGITSSTGMIFGGVHILDVGGTGWRIDTVKPKTAARVFADQVLALAAAYNTQPTALTSEADELKKWAGLLEDGIVTQDEFDAKKRQLLGI